MGSVRTFLLEKTDLVKEGKDYCGLIEELIAIPVAVRRDGCTVAPVFSGTAKILDPMTNLTDLSGLTASNLPVGAIMSWHSDTPATEANKLSSVSAVSPGAYYAAFYDASANCYGPTIEYLIPMNAGGTAIQVFNVCPATTVDLSTITASNVPSEYTLGWFSSATASASTLITNVRALPAGTYYAAFYDASGGCYSLTMPVTATVNVCCPVAEIVPSLIKN